jgi:hypothetical protein
MLRQEPFFFLFKEGLEESGGIPFFDVPVDHML